MDEWSSRDYLIGGACLIGCLVVIFFFGFEMGRRNRLEQLPKDREIESATPLYD